MQLYFRKKCIYAQESETLICFLTNFHQCNCVIETFILKSLKLLTSSKMRSDLYQITSIPLTYDINLIREQSNPDSSHFCYLLTQQVLRSLSEQYLFCYFIPRLDQFGVKYYF